MNLHDVLTKANQKHVPMNLSTSGSYETFLAEGEPTELTLARTILRQQGEQEVRLVGQLGLRRSLEQINDNQYHRFLHQQFRGSVYHVDDIRQVCVHYRMRMLPSHRYCGPIDPEFGPTLASLPAGLQPDGRGTRRATSLLWPRPKRSTSKKRQRPLIDPLLLYRIDGQHYRVVHQWGGDLHPLRYLRAWRHRSLTHMTLFWTAFTFLVTTVLFGLLAESLTNAFLIGWGYYSTLRDSYDEQRHRFSSYNWNQDWIF